MAKTFAFYIYFTDNYSPVTKELKELDKIIIKNDLPKMSLMLYKAFSHFSKKEKTKFEALEKKVLIDSLSKYRDASKERFAEYQELINYLDDLPFEQIATPVKRVTDWLDQTFLAPDPAIFGAIKSSLHLALTQNKEINHVEIKAKTGWFKIIAVVAIIGLALGLVYFAYTGGAFDNLGSMLGGSFGGMNDEQIMAKYPTGAALKSAVDSGALNYDSLSPRVQAIYDSVP